MRCRSALIDDLLHGRRNHCRRAGRYGAIFVAHDQPGRGHVFPTRQTDRYRAAVGGARQEFLLHFVPTNRSLLRSDIMSAEFQLRWKGGPFDAFAFLTTPNQVVPGPPTLPLQFFNPPGPRYTHPVRLVTGTDLCLWRCGAGRYLGGHAPRRNAVTRRSPALRHRPRRVGLARLEKEEKISNCTRCLIGTPDDIPQRPPRGGLSVLCMP